jgi:hypothetical protein
LREDVERLARRALDAPETLGRSIVGMPVEPRRLDGEHRAEYLVRGIDANEKAELLQPDAEHGDCFHARLEPSGSAG